LRAAAREFVQIIAKKLDHLFPGAIFQGRTENPPERANTGKPAGGEKTEKRFRPGNRLSSWFSRFFISWILFRLCFLRSSQGFQRNEEENCCS